VIEFNQSPLRYTLTAKAHFGKGRIAHSRGLICFPF